MFSVRVVPIAICAGFILLGSATSATDLEQARSAWRPRTAPGPPPHPAAASRPSRTELIRFVDSLAQASLQSGPIAGMSIAVVRGSDMVVAKGYGFADLENRVPATEHTVYRIGSITKQFTAAAVLQLVEEKK